MSPVEQGKHLVGLHQSSHVGTANGELVEQVEGGLEERPATQSPRFEVANSRILEFRGIYRDG
jgi:hypothetical protein